MKPRTARFARALAAGVLLVLSVGASEARPAAQPVTINLLTVILDQPAYQVLIANFERVYPNVTVNATYASTSSLIPLEETELAAGNGPDLLDTAPGCGAPNAICDLANAGYLLPLVKEPWLKRSPRVVTSALKHGQGLFGFEPVVAPYGVFTNDSLFTKLGLKVPQTFSQLLALCRTAKTDGTTAVVLPGMSTSPSNLAYALATANLYGRDKTWNSRLRAGTATFAGTAGWRQALQEVTDMADAGCFETGIAAESGPAATTLFADGGGLMEAASSTAMGQVAAAQPSFPFSFHPFPGGTSASGTNTYIMVSDALSINANSAPQSQAAAREFIDFLGRPKQDALFAQLTGGLTQDEFLKQQLPTFMSSFAGVLKQSAYVMKPSLTWWNGSVSQVLTMDTIGLVTGQSTPDGILQAMDAAWNQGPS